MKVEKQTKPEPQLSLQPREKVLWESQGGPERFDPIAWGFSLFWSAVFLLLVSVLLSILLEQIGAFGWQALSFLILAGLLIAATILAFLARHIYNDLSKEIEMNYAITNQRLIAALKSRASHSSYSGRPFSKLEVVKRGDVYDLTLTGINANDPDEVVLQLLGVTDGETAEKLLLKSFMQKTGGKS